MKKAILYLAILLTLPFMACGQKEGINIGEKIYEISGENPDGQTLSLSDL